MADSKGDIKWHEFKINGYDISTDPMFPFIYNGMNIEQSLFEGGVRGTVMLRDVDPLDSYGNKIPWHFQRQM